MQVVPVRLSRKQSIVDFLGNTSLPLDPTPILDIGPRRLYLARGIDLFRVCDPYGGDQIRLLMQDWIAPIQRQDEFLTHQIFLDGELLVCPGHGSPALLQYHACRNWTDAMLEFTFPSTSP